MFRRTLAAAALTVAVLLIASGAARADGVENDLATSHPLGVTLVAGSATSSATVGFKVVAAGGDAEDKVKGAGDCNVDPGESVTFSFVTPTGVSATPSSISFGGSAATFVGCDTWVYTTFTAATGASSGQVSLTKGTDTTGTDNTYNANGAKFSITVTADATPPQISCGAPPTSWQGTNVTIQCTASDAGSGLASTADASFSLSTSVAAGTETSSASTNSRTVLDKAGNSATAGPITGIKVDRKAPGVACGSADTDWHATDVSVSCSASDGGSGLAAESPSSFDLSTSVAAGTEATNASTGTRIISDSVGNSTTAGPVGGHKIDKKAPGFSCGAPATSWATTDATIACTASDLGSGLASAADASFSLSTSVADGTETDNASTATRSISDIAGNSTTAGPLSGNRIDRKGPSLSCGTLPIGWQNANVTINCTASDGGSGLADAGDASFSLSTGVSEGTEDGAASTGSRQVFDAVSNSSTAGPFVLQIDRKDPTVTCEAAPTSWQNTNVSISCTASDSGSDLASTADASFTLSTNVAAGTETSTASTGSHTVFDAAGNSSTVGPFDNLKVDLKDPSVSCGSADSDWHASDVNISCTASDGGSGLANSGDASFNLSTNVPAGTETASASTGTRSILDAAGNSSTAGPIGGNKVDKKGPSVTCGAAPSFLLNQSPAEVPGTAADGGSGPASAAVSASGDTSSAGSKTVAVIGADNVGNHGSRMCAYSVGFDFIGFTSPVDNGTVLNKAKAGQAIPLKWRLLDANGDPVTSLAGASITVGSLNCASGATSDALEEYAAGGSGLQNHGNGYYQWNWKSPSTYASSCKTLKLNLGEASPRTAMFQFTK